MDKNQKDNFKAGINVGQWLQKVNLLDYQPIRLRFTHGQRTGDFSSLKEYLGTHPKILQIGKLRFQVKKMLEDACPFYPFQSQEDFPGEIPLGIINPKGDLFKIEGSDLVRHMLVVGRTGAGKSNFIKLMLMSVSKAIRHVFWIFDPNREYRQIKHLFPNVVVLRVRDFWDNPFERPTFKMPHLEWLDVVSQVFEIELGFKLASKMLLLEAGRYIFRKRGVLDGSNDLSTCKDFFYVLKEKQKKGYTSYQKDAFNPLLNRMEHLMGIGRFFTTPKSIPIEDLLKTNIIFEFDGSTDEIYTLVMSLLLTKAFYYRMWNPEDVNCIHLNIIEEGRVPFDIRRTRNFEFKEPVLNKLMAQYRKFGGGFVVLTQEPSTISSTPKANVHTVVAFSLSQGKEIMDLGQSMMLNHEQLQFFRNLPIGTAVVMYGGKAPFLLDVPKFPENLGSQTDEEIDAEARAFLRRYQNTDLKNDRSDARDPDEIKEQWKGANKTGREHKGQPEPDPMKIIYTLVENPFLKYTELQTTCGFGVSRLNKASKWLVDEGYAAVEKIKISLAKPSKFVVLTDKAYELVKAKRAKGKGSFKSKIFCHLVKSKLEGDCWQATIEGKTPFGDKLIDVLAYKDGIGYIAYEVTISFDNIMDNIRKDIIDSGVIKVVIVVEDEKHKEKARAAVGAKDLGVDPTKIEYATINQFF